MAATCTPILAPSRATLYFLAHDSTTGDESMVTFVSDNNEDQSLTLSGNPSGGTFTLTFDGQTTAPIPAIPTDPYASMRWHATVTPGLHDVAVNLWQSGGSGDPDVSYKVYNGATLLDTVHLNQQGPAGAGGGVTNPAPFDDDTSPTPIHLAGGSTPLPWFALGNYNITSGNLSVMMSGSVAFSGKPTMFADLLRVKPASGAATVVPASDSSSTFSPNSGYWGAEASMSDLVGTARRVGNATGTGTRYLADPTVVRAALEALSSVGAGNVTVTGDGSSQTPIRVKFVGDLSDAAHPLMTCADGALTIARVTAGAILPLVTVTPAVGPPVTYQCRRTDTSYHKITPAMPTVQFLFTQDAPAAEYIVAGTLECDALNPNTWLPGYPDNASAKVQGNSSPAAVCTWRRPVRPAGTYRLSVAWPHHASYAASVTFTVHDSRGALLATVTADLTVAPGGAVDHGVPWLVLGTFTLPPGDDNNGFVVALTNTGGTGILVADTLRIERTSDPVALVIGEDDDVKVSWGAGFITCQAGSVPAGTDVAAGEMDLTLPTTTTMRVGLNKPPAEPVDPCSFYSNYFRMTPYGPYPTDLGTSSAFGYPVNYCYPTFGADGKSYGAIPPGDYDLWWDTADDVTMAATGGTCTEIGTPIFGAGPDNRRTYRLTADSIHYGPEVTINLHGHSVGGGNYALAPNPNVRIFEAGTDPDTAPYFRPEGAIRCAGHKSRRNLDPLGTISGNASELSDYVKNLTRPTRSGAWRIIDAPIYRIEQYTGPLDFPQNTGAAYLITSGDGAGGTGAHGISNWQYAEMQSWAGGAATLADGIGNTTTFDLAGLHGYVWVISSTQYVIRSYGTFEVSAGHPFQMTNVLTNTSSGARMHVEIGNGTPLDDIIAEHNALGLDLYFNTTWCVTDDCLTDLGVYIGTHLAAGLKLRLEASNETWNTTNPAWALAADAGQVVYGTPSNDDVAFKCEQSQRHWTLMKAGWVSAGRDPDDFIRVLAGLHGFTGYTARMAQYCYDSGFTFEEFATAPYFGCTPALGRNTQMETDFADVLDRMTVEQLLDLWDIYVTHGGYRAEAQGHFDALSGKVLHGEDPATYDRPEFQAIGLIAYEGGPAYMLPPWSTGSTGHRLSHASHRHPRHRGIVIRQLNNYAVSGFSLIHIFEETKLDRPDGAMWGMFTHTHQLHYVPGDPVQDAIQIDDFDNMYAIKSVTGGALNYFASILDATETETGDHVLLEDGSRLLLESGDSVLLESDATVEPDFSFTLAPSGTLARSGTLALAIARTPIDDYAGDTPVAITGRPSGVTFDPLTLTGVSPSGTLRLRANSSSTLGVATLTVTLADNEGGPSHSRTLTLTVTAGSVSPTSSARPRFDYRRVLARR